MDPITISAIATLGKELISKVWPNPQDQAEELRKLSELEQKGDLAELQAYITVLQGRMNIINSEASSEHWLTATWRPTVMLTFTLLIVARWFGLSSDSMTEAEYIQAWKLLELGIGGYVVGRTLEKGVTAFRGR